MSDGSFQLAYPPSCGPNSHDEFRDWQLWEERERTIIVSDTDEDEPITEILAPAQP